MHYHTLHCIAVSNSFVDWPSDRCLHFLTCLLRRLLSNLPRASVQCCMCFTRFVEIQTYFLHRLQRLCSAQFDALESSGLTAKHCGYSACVIFTRLCEIQTYYSLAQHTEHLQGITIWVVTRVLYLCMCICVFLSVFM